MFTNTKTWLCNRGIQHWGDRMIIDTYESHDNLRPAVMFGESGWRHGLANARTDNMDGRAGQNYGWNGREGFEFYDTWVKTMLSDIVFRNFTNTKYLEPGGEHGAEEAVVRFMTHSDQCVWRRW